MVVKKGDTVVVEYEGKLETGEVFDSSKHGDQSHPITFTVGENQVIPGFERGIEGMNEKEEKTITLNPEDAYGERKEQLKQTIPKNAIQMDKEPHAGMILNVQAPNGQNIQVPIVATDEQTITVDMNHPLAGKKLIFQVKVLEIKHPENEKKEE